jgi:hypothetical protein
MGHARPTLILGSQVLNASVITKDIRFVRHTYEEQCKRINCTPGETFNNGCNTCGCEENQKLYIQFVDLTNSSRFHELAIKKFNQLEQE